MTERSNILPFKRSPEATANLLQRLTDIEVIELPMAQERTEKLQEEANQLRKSLGRKAVTTFEEIE